MKERRQLVTIMFCLSVLHIVFQMVRGAKWLGGAFGSWMSGKRVSPPS